MRRDDERLADILEAAEKIAVRAAKGRAAFDGDEDTQIVLVHLIQVIGEAAAGLSDGFIAQHPEVPWRQIIATATGSCTVTSRSISTSCGTWRSSTCLSWPARFLRSNPGALPVRACATG